MFCSLTSLKEKKISLRITVSLTNMLTPRGASTEDIMNLSQRKILNLVLWELVILESTSGSEIVFFGLAEAD